MSVNRLLVIIYPLDISTGHHNSEDKCPVALAATRAYAYRTGEPRGCRVDGEKIAFEDECGLVRGPVYDLPDEAMKWVYLFDSNLPVEPGAFVARLRA